MLTAGGMESQLLASVEWALRQGWGLGGSVFFQVLEVVVIGVIVWALVSNLRKSDERRDAPHRFRARQNDETLR